MDDAPLLTAAVLLLLLLLLLRWLRQPRLLLLLLLVPARLLVMPPIMVVRCLECKQLAAGPCSQRPVAMPLPIRMVARCVRPSATTSLVKHFRIVDAIMPRVWDVTRETATLVLRLQPDCVVVCLIGFVEWLCSRRWCLQCFGWALFIGSFATCSTCCAWFAAAWLCTPPAFGVCCFNSGSCRTLNSQRLARATKAQRVTYSASRRLEGHLRHRWQHSNSRRAHTPHCLHARAHAAWWRGNDDGCLRAGQASCTLNTDRTRDSAGRKVGLRTVAAPPRRSGRDGRMVPPLAFVQTAIPTR